MNVKSLELHVSGSVSPTTRVAVPCPDQAGDVLVTGISGLEGAVEHPSDQRAADWDLQDGGGQEMSQDERDTPQWNLFQLHLTKPPVQSSTQLVCHDY